MLGIGTVLDLDSAPDEPLSRAEAFGIAKRPAGRPTSLTEETAQEILLNVSQGSFLTVAAARAGVNRETVYGWLRRGKADNEAGLDTIFVRFSDALARAQAEAETRMVATLSKGGEGKYPDWRAQAFVLERRYRDRWSLPKEQANQGLTLQLSNEQLASLLEGLRVAKATDVTPLPASEEHKG